MIDHLTIRTADPADVPTLWQLIHDLAEHQNRLHEFHLTPDNLAQTLHGPSPLAVALLAEDRQTPVGIALCYRTFPTFAGHPHLFIEDLFVRPKHRRRGIGTALLQACRQKAADLQCAGIQWWTHQTNHKAAVFYQTIGAQSSPPVIPMTLPGST